ncbi:EamA family transporter [Nocardioides caldifontis]|uniref:EamA family transporter n=1 Tax=Nocardioides caldifontis TaxID=2588938 RepID=UPI001396B4E3|nr:EamA family transporter [Nocardioides caldifontis]
MTHRRPGLGFALVSLGALLFIVNAGVSRVVLRSGVSPDELTTTRITGTALVLLLVALLFRRTALRPPTGRMALLLLLHGVVGVAALQWTYFVAIDRLPVGLALLLEYQAPLLVALWARFVQGETVRRRAWLGLGTAMFGLALATGILQGELAWDGLGLLAGLGAAVCFATYFLVGEHGVANLEPLRVVLWSFGIAAVAMNVASPIWHFPEGVLDVDVSLLGRLADVTVPGVLAVGWVVVLGTLVPFAVEVVALRHLSASTVTMVAMLEPVGVALLGWLWFREDLGTVATVGCLLVLLGIIAAQSGRAPHPQEPPHLAAP